MKMALAVLTFASAMVAYAADISGTWKGTADFGGGAVERSFAFKVDGKKLTGETTSERMGRSIITDGVVDGDDVSFTITGKIQDNDVTIHYKGQVKGSEMKLNSDANGQTIEWKLTRVS